MKKHLIALLALGLLLAASAQAQTAMKVNVPFDFVVNGQIMPAGEYRVEAVGLAGNALSIRKADQGATTLALSNACASRDTAEKSKLVFHRYGSEYFLAQVWTAGSNTGHQLPRTRAEREIAGNQTTPQFVAIAALK